MNNKTHDLRISVGDIKNSVGVAIGQDTQASVQQSPQEDAGQITAMLNALVQLIDAHAGALGDAAPAREAVVLACEEAGSPTPRWARIRGLLGLVAPAVAGIAALTDAVDNIRGLIPR